MSTLAVDKLPWKAQLINLRGLLFGIKKPIEFKLPHKINIFLIRSQNF